jgi:hypothetical protein
MSQTLINKSHPQTRYAPHNALHTVASAAWLAQPEICEPCDALTIGYRFNATHIIREPLIH